MSGKWAAEFVRASRTLDGRITRHCFEVLRPAWPKVLRRRVRGEFCRRYVAALGTAAQSQQQQQRWPELDDNNNCSSNNNDTSITDAKHKQQQRQ